MSFVHVQNTGELTEPLISEERSDDTFVSNGTPQVIAADSNTVAAANDTTSLNCEAESPTITAQTLSDAELAKRLQQEFDDEAFARRLSSSTSSSPAVAAHVTDERYANYPGSQGSNGNAYNSFVQRATTTNTSNSNNYSHSLIRTTCPFCRTELHVPQYTVDFCCGRCYQMLRLAPDNTAYGTFYQVNPRRPYRRGIGPVGAGCIVGLTTAMLLTSPIFLWPLFVWPLFFF
eukprot:g3523.t1